MTILQIKKTDSVELLFDFPSDCGATIVEQSEFPLLLSSDAVKMVRNALTETAGEDGRYLRISIRGGGCAGLQYGLDFTNEISTDDLYTIIDGTVFIIDVISAHYLQSTELDYVQSTHASGFKFVNPQAVRTCGCGSSFSATA